MQRRQSRGGSESRTVFIEPRTFSRNRTEPKSKVKNRENRDSKIYIYNKKNFEKILKKLKNQRKRTKKNIFIEQKQTLPFFSTFFGHVKGNFKFFSSYSTGTEPNRPGTENFRTEPNRKSGTEKFGVVLPLRQIQLIKRYSK